MDKKITIALNCFNCTAINFKGRKKGTAGISPLNEMSSLQDVMNEYNINGPSNVESLILHITSEMDKLSTYDKIIEAWLSACAIAKYYNVKVIYHIEKTKYVVCPNSNPDMMTDIMNEPKFYNKKDFYYENSDIVSFNSFYDNTYIIMYTKPKVVGPYTMPKITMTYMEYATTINRRKNNIKEYEKKIEHENEVIACSKRFFYEFLGKNCKLTKEEITSSIKIEDTYYYEKTVRCARTIWSILNGIIKEGKNPYNLSSELWFVIDNIKRNCLWDDEILQSAVKGLIWISRNKRLSKQTKALINVLVRIKNNRVH